MNGRLRGRLTPNQSKNVFLRLAQYERSKDEEFKLRIARSILEAKIKNQTTLILRYQRNHPEVDFAAALATLSNSLSALPHKKAISSLMGLEGASTGAYFQCFAKMLSPDFTFDRRTRHPPLDPVNALLSLGYVLITNELAALTESIGFDPFIGFLHGLRYGRQSLSLDLVEEFRHPVIDGLVLTLLNKRSIKESDFHQESNGAFFLNKEAFRRFIALYEERMEKPFLYKQENSYLNYRRLFRNQVENMEKAVLNKGEYQPFLVH
jgi:CRISPR-associated protein Cas1